MSKERNSRKRYFTTLASGTGIGQNVCVVWDDAEACIQECRWKSGGERKTGEEKEGEEEKTFGAAWNVRVNPRCL